jgi:hypothetical protein
MAGNKESQFYPTKLPSFLSWLLSCFSVLFWRKKEITKDYVLLHVLHLIPFSFSQIEPHQEDRFDLSTPWSCNPLHVPLINPLIHHQILLAWNSTFGFWILTANLCTREFCPASWCLEAWSLDPFNKLLGTKHISKSNHILMIYLWSNISMLFVALDQLWSRISRDLPSKIIM